MRRDLPPVLALAAAWWLLADLTAVWGPSLLTVLGSTASTPVWPLGLFALGCVAAAFALVALTRRPGSPVALLAVALLARIVLAATPGGQVQLWAASVGFAAALAWFAHLAVRHGQALASGLATGWLLTATVAAVGGTWLPVWRTDPIGIVCTIVLVLLAVSTLKQATTDTAPLSRRQAWSIFPVALVAGIAVVNAGRASTIITDTGPLLLVIGCATAALSVAALGRAHTPWGRLAAGLVGVLLVMASLWGTWAPESLHLELAWWLAPMLVVAPVCLAVLLTPDLPDRAEPDDLVREDAGLADLSPLHDRQEAARAASPFLVLGGAVVWALGLFGYYAGYDLGYRADVLVPVVLAVVVIGVWEARPLPARTGGPAPALYGVTAIALVAATVGAWQHRQPTAVERTASADVSITAWNLRMGYGTDGRFDPEAVARQVQDSDVVLLSEIDRGWLLTGGQDQLAILAQLTGKRLYFAPAADPVWGDAVLTSLPVTEVVGRPLASFGAPTGAEALAVRLRASGRSFWVVSTHLQPKNDGNDRTIDQTGQVARFARSLTGDGSGVILAGDFDFEPGSRSFSTVLQAGFEDALAADRPAPTFTSNNPEEERDHIFVSSRIEVLDARVETSNASDHLPVSARLRVP